MQDRAQQRKRLCGESMHARTHSRAHFPIAAHNVHTPMPLQWVASSVYPPSLSLPASRPAFLTLRLGATWKKSAHTNWHRGDTSYTAEGGGGRAEDGAEQEWRSRLDRRRAHAEGGPGTAGLAPSRRTLTGLRLPTLLLLGLP